MIKIILVDFSRTLIYPTDKKYTGKLNPLYRSIIQNKKYDFFKHFFLNKKLIDYLQPFKKKYYVCVFTTDIIQNDPAIKPILEENFSEIFAANDLGIDKKDPSGYKKLASILNEESKNILLIDDTIKKIEAAKKAGFQTIQFISNKQLFKELESKI